MAREGRKSPKESNFLWLLISAKVISLMSKVSFSTVELWFLFWREIVKPVEQLCDSHNLCFFEYRIMCFTSFIGIFKDQNLQCFKPQCCKLPYSAQYSKFTSSKTSGRRSPRKS